MILAIAACEGEPAGRAADTGPQEPCLSTTTVIAEDDDGIGFSAQDVLASSGSPAAAAFSWSDGGESTITLVAGTVAEVRRVDRDDNDAYTADTGRISCTDYLEFDADLSFATADAALVGSGPATFSAFDFQALTVKLEVGDEALTGSYVPPADRVGDGEAWTLNLGASMNAGTTTGSVSGYAATTGGSDNQLWNIGAW